MNNLCRICLKVSDQNMQNVQENEILFKIRTFLTIEISTDSSLPKQICKECSIKTTELYEFCLSIQESEAKLKSYLKNGCLQEFYSNLQTNIDSKDEKTDIVFCENNYVKTEDTTYCEVAGTNIKEIENIDKCENLKQEDSIDDIQDCHYSSNDELTLATLKKEEDSQEPNKKIKTKKKLKQKTNEELSNNSNSSTDNIKQFTCLSCLSIFESQNSLIQHYHNEHLKKVKNTAVNYSECNLDGNITYSCKTCEHTCNIKKDIIKHVAIHVDERPLICKLCGRTYKTVPEIIRHSRVHNGVRLQCSYKCGYSTVYQGALKEHENRHLNVYKYTCDKCGVGFHVKTWYEQHQNIHTGLKPYVCDICGHAFHMARYLSAHKSLKHPQSSSVKRYICVHCEHKCDSANSLALHLEEHGINKEKEFLCDFCGKILASADQLKYHHRMHSGVKPYSCSICNKTFAKKFNVKIHMSSHSGEKSHACTRCGKRYIQRSTLLRHLKRHHGGASPKRSE
ncbi:gastrula zinc finger protein XlCGF26.1-like [Spodoptera frugiperda]|uniref:Gastrula zinc finger protein XlCGF26.1-like n=1 Tax=Spodoptera frugiperda TaxID=7108 RepID=A0A9R0F083_SPOFR|nr:gastrula zinc finger protein XlCGF26.1-like [Spodoptera frugiperda]